MADTTTGEAVMSERKSMPMSERVRVVALVGTVLAILSYVLGMPSGWTLLGFVAALVAWPTYAIVRSTENRPPASSNQDG